MRDERNRRRWVDPPDGRGIIHPVKRRCRTVLQSKAKGAPETPSQLCIALGMHIPPWFWFRATELRDHSICARSVHDAAESLHPGRRSHNCLDACRTPAHGTAKLSQRCLSHTGLPGLPSLIVRSAYVHAWALLSAGGQADDKTDQATSRPPTVGI